VWLFFALSGYLLYLPFARRDYADGGGVDHQRYALNRMLRILPLYYVVLIVFMLVNEHGGTGGQWLRFATFTESYSGSTVRAVDGPMWSVAVEIQFYALLPLLAIVINKISGGSVQRAAGVIVALGLASLLIWWVEVHAAVIPDYRWRYSLPATFLNFVPGLLLALVQARARSLRLPPAWLMLGVAGALYLGAVDQIEWAQLLCAPAAALLIASVVLPVRASSSLNRLLDVRVLGLIGVASYSLYLWHWPIVTSLATRTGFGVVPLTALVLAICLPIAFASYYLVERPALQLRGRWWASRQRTSAGPVAAVGLATAAVAPHPKD
jgi:peptidoglycan/LPS O-acetylase OafA/YrhL